METKEKTEAIIITDWEVFPQLRRFCVNHPNVRVITLDRIISYHLSRLGIVNHCAYDLISVVEEEKIFSRATADINEIFSELIGDPRQDLNWREFIDANKSALSDSAVKAYFQNGYFERLFSLLQLQKVYFFYYSGNSWCAGLKNFLENSAYNYEALNFGLLVFLKIKMRHFPDYINQLATFENRDIILPSGVCSIWRRYKVAKHNNKVNINVGCRILFSVLLLDRDIAVNLPVFLEMKRLGRHPLIIVPWSFKKKSLKALSDNGIEYFYLELKSVGQIDREPEKFFLAAEQLVKKIFPENNYGAIFRQNQLKILGLAEKYGIYLSCREAYWNIFNQIRPAAFWGCHNFSVFFRIGLMQAIKSGVKTVSIIGPYANNNFYSQIVPPVEAPVILSLCSAETYLVTGEIFKRGIDQNTADNKTQIEIFSHSIEDSRKYSQEEIDATRRRVLDKFNIPRNSQLVAYAGQTGRYNFDFVWVLAKAVKELTETNGEWKNYYLLVRPHPREIKLFYKLLQLILNDRVIISNEFSLTDIIFSSQRFICRDSFSAVEAMALGTKVVFIDWLHRADRPDFHHLTLAVKIDKISEIKASLSGIAGITKVESGEFDDQFNQYFQLQGQTLPDIVAKIIGDDLT